MHFDHNLSRLNSASASTRAQNHGSVSHILPLNFTALLSIAVLYYTLRCYAMLSNVDRSISESVRHRRVSDGEIFFSFFFLRSSLLQRPAVSGSERVLEASTSEYRKRLLATAIINC